MRAFVVAVAVGVLATAAAYDSHVYGVDVSTLVSKSQFECLKGNNLTFAIIRGYQSTGNPDPNVVATVNNAWAAGLSEVDVYMFPCYKCGNPAGQVKAAVTHLHNNRVRFNRFWFDIEGPGLYWSSNQGDNVAFFEAMKNEITSLGVPAGVYTSASQWQPIMGGYTGGASYPLWYAHYDGIPDFSDFRGFNGWSKPNRKQFSDAGAKCGVSYDINWYPPAAVMA